MATAVEVKIMAGDAKLAPLDGNVDVEVLLSDGRRFSATFLTRKNIDAIFQRYSDSGECASGLYFWVRDMIVVDLLSTDTIERTIDDLIQTGEFEAAFGELGYTN